MRRYTQNERALKKKGQWEHFEEAVDEYAQLHHAEPVPMQDLTKAESLPMHGMMKEASTTTKLRMAFDASARTSTGHSFNDTLLPGPFQYPLLTSILVKFRQHTIRMSSDISKMFREVELHKEERDYHRYITRNKDTNEMEDWRMTRLTFGVASSPFIATQVLRSIADEHQVEYPKAAVIVRQSFYVDDCLTGTSSVTEAIPLREELNNLLSRACMRLRKWRSNSSELLQSIQETGGFRCRPNI